MNADLLEVEAVVKKAFDQLDTGRLTFRRLLFLHRRASWLLRVLRGDEISVREILEHEAGIEPA